MSHSLFTSLQQSEYGSAACGNYYSLPTLEEAGLGQVPRLLISLRIVLESVLRDYDGK